MVEIISSYGCKEAEREHLCQLAFSFILLFHPVTSSNLWFSPHSMVCFTNLLGVSQDNRVDKINHHTSPWVSPHFKGSPATRSETRRTPCRHRSLSALPGCFSILIGFISSRYVFHHPLFTSLPLCTRHTVHLNFLQLQALLPFTKLQIPDLLRTTGQPTAISPCRQVCCLQSLLVSLCTWLLMLTQAGNTPGSCCSSLTCPYTSKLLCALHNYCGVTVSFHAHL